MEKNYLRPPPLEASEIPWLPYIDLWFFSEYIPELGMDVEVLYLHQPPGGSSKSMYFVLASSYPPGSLYLQSAKSAPTQSNTYFLTNDINPFFKVNMGASSFRAI